MKKLKEKGITLITLVVTIIILLILTGVTLSIALPQNGLFDRAKQATEKYKDEQIEEEEKLVELEKQLSNEKETIEIKVTPEGWTNVGVEVEIISKSGNNKIQYSLDGEDWKNYDNKFKVENNGIIYAKLVNENDIEIEKTEREIKNIDKLNPETLEVNYEANKTSIEINVSNAKDAEATKEDGKSDISKYRFSKDNGESWSDYQESTNYKFDELYGDLAGQKYEIVVEAIDNAGNSIEKKEEVMTVCKNSTYYTETANELICTISGRAYYKTNSIGAIATCIYGYRAITNTSWAMPFLLSTNPEGVKYTTLNNVCTGLGSVEYHGTTYYYSDLKYWMDGNPVVPNSKFLALNTSSNRYNFNGEEPPMDEITKDFLDLYFKE